MAVKHLGFTEGEDVTLNASVALNSFTMIPAGTPAVVLKPTSPNSPYINAYVFGYGASLFDTEELDRVDRNA